MNVSVLYSGGKDSNYALFWALNNGLDVIDLVSIKPEADDSYMFHKPCIDMTVLQAEAIGLALDQRIVSGVKEDEVLELENILKSKQIDGIVSGAVASEYQKSRIDRICEKLNIKSFSPLWHKDAEALVKQMIDAGFEIMVVGVYADGLSDAWLGRILDNSALRDLKALSEKYHIHIAGEGGEYESLVVDGPIFKRKIRVEDFVKHWNGVSGHISITKAILG